MTLFINYDSKSTLYNYDAIRNAAYMSGLPLVEEEIDKIFDQYTQTGEVPDYIEDYIEAYGNE